MVNSAQLLARRRARRQGGTSVVEMALVLPLLLLLTFGIGEFGIMYTQWQSLTNATREGARVGVVFRAACNTGTVTALIQTTVDSYAASAGIPTGTITTTITNACAGINTPLTVATSLPHSYFALSALAGLGATTTLRARTVMRNE